MITMAEETTPTAPTAPAEPMQATGKEAPGTEPTTPEPHGDGTDWKSEARKWEQRAKENSKAAEKLQELEDAKKTAEERATEKATKAEERAAEAELRALRLEVAAEKGLTPAQAKRLAGKDRAELEADADDFIAETKAKGGEPEWRPKDRMRPGATPSAGDSTALNGDPLLRDLKAKLGIS